MNGKKWSMVGALAGILGGLLGAVEIVATIQASSYEREEEFKELEQRYGLKPVCKISKEEE